ncbi:hypothetical protein HS088_TW23G00625 [Tripterygium wilfordii]|uniref:Uncharacterized protein n=1 Tax=Tripterygium wilfordii TaxID=458696 RepID=A0A7J7BVI2_TRIWF|nr:hypothetical protein HS088_TW23G00625 [Tripterygium wilfordii]
MLEDIAQYLFSDGPLTPPSYEKCLMSRVNSLCCRLQKDPSLAQSSQLNGASCIEEPIEKADVQLNHGDMKASEKGVKDVSPSKQTSAMSRKDSFGHLLLHLPRIASLPKFLFNISEEDGEGQAIWSKR